MTSNIQSCSYDPGYDQVSTNTIYWEQLDRNSWYLVLLYKFLTNSSISKTACIYQCTSQLDMVHNGL